MKRRSLIILFAALTAFFAVYNAAYAVQTPMVLTWDKNTEADLKEYRLYLEDHNTGAWELIATIPAGVEFYARTISDGTRKWGLTAVDTSNNESEKATVIVTTPFPVVDNTAPMMPVNFQAKEGLIP
jgi:hypothetical protein